MRFEATACECLSAAVGWSIGSMENIARTTDDRIDRVPGVKDAIDAVAKNRFILVALLSGTTPSPTAFEQNATTERFIRARRSKSR